jgi:2-keto-4-pentenoate hydratase
MHQTMGSSFPALEAIAEAFATARREARPLAALPGPLPVTLAEAYRVQDLAITLGGRRVRGWKVALIKPELRAAFGGTERMAGPIFADSVHELPAGGHAAAAMFAGGTAFVEAEFVARFSHDLTAGPEGFTPESILAAIGSLHSGFEIVSSPLATLGELGPIGVVCDHGHNAGAVVGPEVMGWQTQPPESLTTRMVVDGVVVGEGSMAAVPGGPIASLRFLAEHLATRERHLAAGDIVLTGATTGMHQARIGGRARIVFAGVPDCEIEVVAATARTKS